MASIKFSQDGHGKARYIVYFQKEKALKNGKRVFKTIDEACDLLFEIETSAMARRHIDIVMLRQDWLLQKLIWFFIGMKHTRMRRNELKLSSYVKQRYDLLAMLETKSQLLKKPITMLCALDFSSAFRASGVQLLYSAYNVLLRNKVINFNPVEKPPKRLKKPITVPSKKAVDALLKCSKLREQIVYCLGAICGLRIGEALAITYADVSEKFININKQMTDTGVTAGLKQAIQRRVPMPKMLWDRLDKEKLDTNEPLVASSLDGGFMKNGYSTSGKLREGLDAQGIVTFHHLRHFAVSRLAERGTDIFRVSRLIGHRKVSTTMDVYGHLFSEWLDLDFE
jgi:integrase